jgi:hypothetical protein
LAETLEAEEGAAAAQEADHGAAVAQMTKKSLREAALLFSAPIATVVVSSASEEGSPQELAF